MLDPKKLQSYISNTSDLKSRSNSLTKWRIIMNINFKTVLKYTGLALLGAGVCAVIYQLAKDQPLPEGVDEVIDEVLNK